MLSLGEAECIKGGVIDEIRTFCRREHFCCYSLFEEYFFFLLLILLKYLLVFSSIKISNCVKKMKKFLLAAIQQNAER
jgi:hypothetical protein